nr:alpha-n-acetylglucosaminidase [Quercus suber]
MTDQMFTRKSRAPLAEDRQHRIGKGGDENGRERKEKRSSGLKRKMHRGNSLPGMYLTYSTSSPSKRRCRVDRSHQIALACDHDGSMTVFVQSFEGTDHRNSLQTKPTSNAILPLVMRFFSLLTWVIPTLVSSSQLQPSTVGIEELIHRRMPEHAKRFSFSLFSNNDIPYNRTFPLNRSNDVYTVSNAADNNIHIAGSSTIALASGLRDYLSNYAHVDIYWFIGSRLDLAPVHLPPVNGTYNGSSIVPWRYHFNTVTFSYTSAFWTWEDWELQLDWLALRGVNLPLAWVGYEKILVDVFLEAGFREQEIYSFLSGPAVQAWNRFGNIQGSWGGELPTAWVEDQFKLQKKIIARMVELGMTPVLPCFTGFVPKAIDRVAPNASFVTGSQWEGFSANYTNDTFLEPFDPLFAELQNSFIEKQKHAYGDVSSFYALDQYNENDPYSGSVDYLENIAKSTVQSLKAADENAVWVLQGWLFFSSLQFWTDERVEAYLSGATNDEMLILDLFSESQPQWQRTNNYFGKPWIWCELHGYGYVSYE